MGVDLLNVRNFYVVDHEDSTMADLRHATVARNTYEEAKAVADRFNDDPRLRTYGKRYVVHTVISANPTEYDVLGMLAAHAEEHYEEGGWDIYVEAEEDWQTLIALRLRGFSEDFENALACIAERLGIVADYREDIRNS